MPILLLSEPAGAAMGEVVARELIPTVYTAGGPGRAPPGGHAGLAPGRGRSEARQRHAPGGRRFRRGGPDRRGGRAGAGAGATRGSGRIWRSQTSPPTPSPPRSWPASRLSVPAWIARAAFAGPAARRQLGRDDRARLVALRPRALRDLPLRVPALGRRLGRAHRGGRPRGLAARAELEDPGQPRALPGRGGAHQLREGIRAGREGGYRDGARRLRRRGPASAFRRGRRAAHRGPPPAGGRHRDHGPADGRLRARLRGAPRRRGGADRLPGRRDGVARRSGPTVSARSLTRSSAGSGPACPAGTCAAPSDRRSGTERQAGRRLRRRPGSSARRGSPMPSRTAT